jgi:hypothetical protein
MGGWEEIRFRSQSACRLMLLIGYESLPSDEVNLSLPRFVELHGCMTLHARCGCWSTTPRLPHA